MYEKSRGENWLVLLPELKHRVDDNSLKNQRPCPFLSRKGTSRALYKYSIGQTETDARKSLESKAIEPLQASIIFPFSLQPLQW